MDVLSYAEKLEQDHLADIALRNKMIVDQQREGIIDRVYRMVENYFQWIRRGEVDNVIS